MSDEPRAAHDMEADDVFEFNEAFTSKLFKIKACVAWGSVM